MLTSSQTARETTITVRGALDVEHARRLKRQVQRASADGFDTIVVDLAAVTAIDALGLGAILALDSDCADAGRSLEVVPPPGAAGTALLLLGGAGRLRFRTGE
jgi:anti-anti-sigma factor